MEWIWSNLIITLNSSVFIIIYLALIIFCRKLYHRYEFKLLNQPFENAFHGENDDPLFIAWLKDPRHGIFKMVFGPLLQEGYIRKGDIAGAYQTTNKIKPEKTVQETFLLNYFSTPNSLSYVQNHFQELKATFRDKAERFQLIIQKETRNKVLRCSRITSLTLMALGIYRVAGTIDTGSYDIFILFFIIFPVIPFLFDENRVPHVTLSLKGKKYLESLQKRLSESSTKNVNQAWLLRILGGSTLISELHTVNDNYIYINWLDSHYDSSVDSSCDLTVDSGCDSSADSGCSSSD